MEDQYAGGAGIRLLNVTLRLPTFVQHQSSADSWIKTLVGAALDRPERRLHTILDDISLDVNEGDRLALIGRNGAGKTSLLHVLTGCFVPTEGTIDVRGTRQALLNVTLGFNFEATVRENIFLRGCAMGLPINQIRSSLDEILDFAGIESLAAQRLGTLSAGQRMRLGFAISTTVQPDILLLDEWIGAGDAEFLAKARARMMDRVSGSRIMVLASHSSDLLSKVCNRGVVLDAGRILFNGSIKDALDLYKNMGSKTGASAPEIVSSEVKRRGLAHASMHGFEFSHPIHVVFENVTRGEDGSEIYGFLIEVGSVSVADALSRLSNLFFKNGLYLDGCAGPSMPNKFMFQAQDGRRAEVVLRSYAPSDKRQMADSTGTLHVKLNNGRAGH